MIRCLIVEDELPAQKVLKTYIGDAPMLELTGCFNNALDAMALLQQDSVDLLFLDIHLPKISGLNFLRSIKNPPTVIITSAYPEYALEGFELNVLDYLLKPFSFERFLSAVNRYESKQIADHLNKSEEVGNTDMPKDHLFVKKDKSFIKVFHSDIIYLESDRDFVKIHTKERSYLELQSLKYYEAELPKNFIRVHKSYLINTRFLSKIDGNKVTVSNQVIPVGRSFKEGLMKKLGL